MTELKKKVTLKQKQIPSEPERKPIQTTPKKKCKWWIWVLIAVIVAIIVILLVKNKKSDVDPISIDPTPAVVVTDTNSLDVQQDENATNVAPEEDNNNETTPAQGNSASLQNNEPTVPVVTPNESNNSKSSNIANTPTLSNDLEENAHRAIRGDFGNGQARKDALGNSYNEIQNRVNEIYRERNMH